MLNPQRFQIKIGERYTDKLAHRVHWTSAERSVGPKRKDMVNKILVQKPLTVLKSPNA